MRHLLPIDSPLTRERVTHWLAQGNLVVAEVYRPHSGAGGHLYVLAEVAHFDSLVALSPRRHVVLFARWAPVRGVVDRAFVDAVVGTLPENADYLAAPAKVYPDELSASDGRGRANFTRDLVTLQGQLAFAGPYPPLSQKYWLPDTSPDALTTRT